MSKKVKEILEELKNELKINEEIKVIIKDYKYKLASVSLDKKLIRINKRIINDEKLLRDVLFHELLHIKLDTVWHTPEFFFKYKDPE